MLVTHWGGAGAVHLMAEYLIIVLTYLGNQQATHTVSPQHFEVMHINRNAFKENNLNCIKYCFNNKCNTKTSNIYYSLKEPLKLNSRNQS